MRQLITRHIVPKLDIYLRNDLYICPSRQDIAPFARTMHWHPSIIDATTMANLLERPFFSKWIAALHQWMAAEPDLEEVKAWYFAWKTRFPPPLQATPQLEYQFKRALDLINVMVEAPETPLAHFNAFPTYMSIQNHMQKTEDYRTDV